MKFTEQEFNRMVDDLISDSPDYNRLFSIVEKELKRYVHGKVSGSHWLSNYSSYDEIMQNIRIRVYQYVVTRFLLKDGPEGKINRDAEHFVRWLYTVARNVILSRIEQIKRLYDKEDINGNYAPDLPDVYEEIAAPDEVINTLQNAFRIVIFSKNINIYKILTWLVQSLYVIEDDLTRIEAKNKLLANPDELTLYDMYSVCVLYSEKIPWLSFGKLEKEILLRALNEPYDSKRVYGDVVYSEFFMAKGADKSVSDWVNRLDNKIRRLLKWRNI